MCGAHSHVTVLDKSFRTLGEIWTIIIKERLNQLYWESNVYLAELC